MKFFLVLFCIFPLRQPYLALDIFLTPHYIMIIIINNKRITPVLFITTLSHFSPQLPPNQHVCQQNGTNHEEDDRNTKRDNKGRRYLLRKT